ncbi:hypothetical protein CFE53_05085 [Methanofervidicoccus sp. A16]|uniref:hypothetical protein n=1 Tax=Methanofervidicoccus sp. A16 TaxID=2607662 RepID=UPI00118BEBFD|nr:hypothetical protein [Methanofervidicoccus sp. A16]AXI25533.1 hypothetical protein CFE53_05085 [Methanofervidicoccus sp. A16]
MECKTYCSIGEDDIQWKIKIPHTVCRALYNSVFIAQFDVFKRAGFSIAFGIMITCEVDKEEVLICEESVFLTKEEFKKLIELFEEAYSKMDEILDSKLLDITVPNRPHGVFHDSVGVIILGTSAVLFINHKFKTGETTETIYGIRIFIKKEDFEKLIEFLKEVYNKLLF